MCFFCLMIRRPPRSTRTDTRFPYTTLFRSKSILQQSKIPAIAPVVLSDACASAPDNDFSFMIPNSLKQYAQVYCGAFEKMGYKSLGILGDASEIGRAHV